MSLEGGIDEDRRDSPPPRRSFATSSPSERSIDDVEVPLFPGVFAIFGHGNVTSLGLALHEAR